MIVVTATIRIRGDKISEFEAYARESEALVRASEPGCELYRMVKSRTEPNSYACVEIFRDQAALDQHGSTDHFKEGLEKMQAWLTDVPVGEFYDTLD